MKQKAAARRAFSRAASSYEQYGSLPAEVGQRLLERLDGLKFEPATIADLGCANGRQSLALKKRFPKASVVALDSSQAMLAEARRHRGWWQRRFEIICGDIERLPLAEDSLDLAFVNLALHGCQVIDQALANLRRVMRPGGLVLLSVPGLDTLKELRQAWHQVEAGTVRVMPFTDAQRLGSALTQAGFAEPVLDTDWLKTRFDHPSSLLDSLKHSGFINTDPSRPRGLTHPQRLQRLIQRMMENSAPGAHQEVTWEFVYASAWAPDHGQPLRTGKGEEASVPVSRIGIRQRGP